MSVEVAGLGESEEADVARVGLFPTVDADVFGQSGAVGERLVAQSAPVRSGSSVCPHVRRHRRALTEPSVAYLAFERLVPIVCPQMSRQVGRL